MAADLYVYQLSSPSRACVMLCKKAGIPVNMKVIDLFSRHQYEDKFLQMNPHHQVPVVDDKGFYLYESRAIMRYLLAKFGDDRTECERLYPSDPQQRAKIDQILDRDLSCVYPPIRDYVFPQYCNIKFEGAVKPDEEGLKKVHEALTNFEKCCVPKEIPFLTGDDITMADISLAASISFLEAIFFQDFSQWPKLEAWLHRIQAQDFYKESKLNKMFYELIESHKPESDMDREE